MAIGSNKGTQNPHPPRTVVASDKCLVHRRMSLFGCYPQVLISYPGANQEPDELCRVIHPVYSHEIDLGIKHINNAWSSNCSSPHPTSAGISAPRRAYRIYRPAL